jgi:hypothetical protein
MNFWYNLDYVTNASLGPGYCKVTADMKGALNSIQGFYFNSPIYSDTTSLSENRLNETRVLAHENPALGSKMAYLVNSTLSVMSNHFGNNLLDQDSLELQELAFTHFGQGTLYDDAFDPNTPNRKRRPSYMMVHVMDGKTDFYYFWYFVLSQYMINNNSLDNQVLLQLTRYIGLAAEIDFRLEPKQSPPNGTDPENPSIDVSTLLGLKAKWLGNTDFDKTGQDMRLLMESYRQRLTGRQQI